MKQPEKRPEDTRAPDPDSSARYGETSPERPDQATSDRLRADIDSGRANDKIPFEDPAAAPLGTDDEAAGTPPTPGQVETARHQETRSRPTDDEVPHDRRNITDRQKETLPMRQIATVVVVAIVGVLIVVMLF